MNVKGEILKTTGVILLFWGIVICGIMIFSTLNKTIIFLIITVILFIAVYLFFLKNNLNQIKNEYENDINEHDKQYNKSVEETKKDLEKRGMTFSGEAVKKLGSESVYTLETLGQPMPKGELEINKEDYKKYRTKKFELDFKRAKYKVLIKLFKK